MKRHPLAVKRTHLLLATRTTHLPSGHVIKLIVIGGAHEADEAEGGHPILVVTSKGISRGRAVVGNREVSAGEGLDAVGRPAHIHWSTLRKLKQLGELSTLISATPLPRHRGRTGPGLCLFLQHRRTVEGWTQVPRSTEAHLPAAARWCHWSCQPARPPAMPRGSNNNRSPSRSTAIKMSCSWLCYANQKQDYSRYRLLPTHSNLQIDPVSAARQSSRAPVAQSPPQAGPPHRSRGLDSWCGRWSAADDRARLKQVEDG